jgi:serine/threonine-protein kinase
VKGGPASEDSSGSEVIAGVWKVEARVSMDRHVYRGVHMVTGQQVLIKRLSEGAARDRTIRSRFLKETELLQDLEHDNLVSIIGVVDDGTRPAFIMERPSGETLAQAVERLGRFPTAAAISLALQVLGVLDYMHGQGVFHRNMRADNIYVGPHPETGLPHITLTDFGVAQTVVPTPQGVGVSSGTLMGMKVADTSSHVVPSPYMAPEVLREESDSRSDIYALGVILFELITGRTPIAAGVDDPEAIVKCVTEESPTMLRLLRPEASAELEQVFHHMLDKEPDRRFIDVSECRTALLRAAGPTMIRVPSGEFLMGAAEDDQGARPEEKPQRRVYLDAYAIDRHPVTVAQFWRYLESTGTPVPEGFAQYNPKNLPDHPVVFVTWDEAQTYAEWAGKRLPTEAEWERAARGEDGRIYPWGNDPPDATRAAFGKLPGRRPVTAHPAGASPHGVLDMCGNVFEWVADWYSKAAYANDVNENPKGPEYGTKRVLRGGSFVHDAFAVRCSTRGRYSPDARRANHGFRCVWSLFD